MPTELRVIGAGFGRTGTDSMRVALEMLGVGPCHHMRALVESPDHKQAWRRFIAGGRPDWTELLGGYGSCVDWPTAQFWPDLIAAFPDAKVVLTWRTAESWWTSFADTILPRLLADTDTEETAPGSQLLARLVFGGKPLTRDNCIAAYEANVARVRTEVPASRLLVFPIGAGWQPLCDFLGVPVPEPPFPRANAMGEFQKWSAANPS